MRVVAFTLAALALGSTVAGAATSVDTNTVSGLRGIVTRGPTTPVCQDSEPCEEPAAGVVLQFRRAGSLVAQTRTGSAGGYRLKLRHGIYAVTSPTRPRIGRGLTPRTARVPRGRVARVDFHIDTGIQ